MFPSRDVKFFELDFSLSRLMLPVSTRDKTSSGFSSTPVIELPVVVKSSPALTSQFEATGDLSDNFEIIQLDSGN